MNSRLPTPLKIIVQAVKIWWDEWFMMIAMSLLWLLAWLTIVFGPPVTFAFYYYAQRLVDESYPEKRAIYTAGKRFFLKSWAWMLGNGLVFFLLIGNYMFYGQIQQGWANMLKIVSIAAGFLWLGVQFYALPYLMLQTRPSLRLAWRNGLFTTLASPLYSVILWIFVALLLILSLGTVLPFLLGVPGLVVILGSQAAAERVATFNVLKRDANRSQEYPDEER